MTQYKDIAEVFNSSTRMNDPVRNMIYKAWLKECGNVSGLKVLDLGCGGGESSRMLAAMGAIVSGIDIEPETIRIAGEKEKKNPLGIKYATGDVSRIISDAKKYDFVSFVNLLHYSQSIEALENMIANISASLDKGGRFTGINLNPNHPVDSYLPRAISSHQWLDSPFVEGSRMEVTIYSFGRKICSFMNYHWEKETYDRLFRKHHLSLEWVKIKFEDPSIKNRKELEERLTIIIIKGAKL